MKFTLVKAICLFLFLFCLSGPAVRASYLYVLNEVNGNKNRLYGFDLNEATGELKPLPGFPILLGIGLGAYPISNVGTDRVNNRIYIVENGPRIRYFSVDMASGALTPLFRDPFNIPDAENYGAIAVHPSGSPLVVGGGIQGRVRSFLVTSEGLVEAPGSPYFTGDAQPISSVFSKDGSYYYTGGNSGSTIAGFKVDAGSGIFTALPGSPFNSGANFPGAYAMDSNGRLFSANWRSTSLRVFRANDGVLSPASGNPFNSGLSDVVFGALDPKERFYYVTDRQANKIGTFRIGGSGPSTTLTEAFPKQTTGGLQTNSLQINSLGSIMVAANADSLNLTTFRINRLTGELTQIKVQQPLTLGETGYLAGMAYFPTVLPEGARPRFDFDGDGVSDLAVRRPSDNVWYFLRTTAGFTGLQYGEPGDIMAPADYDGDGKTDVAIFRPSSGIWYVAGSAAGFYAAAWGAQGDLPVPADYDGDGKADLAVFRPSNGTWYRKLSKGDQLSIVQFGTAEDKPQLGDFDGDGKADLAVFRPSNNTWYFLRTSSGFTAISWGIPGDIAAPSDYDGDGKQDVAVFRPSTGIWFIAGSSSGFSIRNWGADGDIPISADYDGDGKSDVALFRPSINVWYIYSTTSGISQYSFGADGDAAIASAFSF